MYRGSGKHGAELGEDLFCPGNLGNLHGAGDSARVHLWRLEGSSQASEQCDPTDTFASSEK